MALLPSGFSFPTSMRKLPHILVAVTIVILLAGLMYPWLDELKDRMNRPTDPEAIIDSIVDGKVANIELLYRDDFPIAVLIDHLQDERPLRRGILATHGPNRAFMFCSRALQCRLGLGPDPEVRLKWNLPVPEHFEDRAGFHKWWEASSKDDLLIRHEMATWQLAEMEKSPDRFEINLPFKRREVAETKRQLDAR